MEEIEIKKAKVVKQGDSLHVIIPSWYCQKQGIVKGDIISLSVSGQKLIITKIKKTSKQMEKESMSTN